MSYVDALQEELRGYEMHGKTDRADQVRAELARVTGAAVQRSAATEDERSAPRGRRAPSKSRGD